MLIDPHVVPDNNAIVKHYAQAVVAEVDVFVPNLRFVWNETAKGKTEKLLDERREIRESSNGIAYSKSGRCNMAGWIS